jgi:hypothetical protein
LHDFRLPLYKCAGFSSVPLRDCIIFLYPSMRLDDFPLSLPNTPWFSSVPPRDCMIFLCPLRHFWHRTLEKFTTARTRISPKPSFVPKQPHHCPFAAMKYHMRQREPLLRIRRILGSNCLREFDCPDFFFQGVE